MHLETSEQESWGQLWVSPFPLYSCISFIFWHFGHCQCAQVDPAFSSSLSYSHLLRHKWRKIIYWAAWIFTDCVHKKKTFTQSCIHSISFIHSQKSCSKQLTKQRNKNQVCARINQLVPKVPWQFLSFLQASLITLPFSSLGLCS